MSYYLFNTLTPTFGVTDPFQIQTRSVSFPSTSTHTATIPQKQEEEKKPVIFLYQAKKWNYNDGKLTKEGSTQKEKVTTKYQRDENGKYVRDENGEKVKEGVDPKWLTRYNNNVKNGKWDQEKADAKIQKRVDRHNRREERKQGRAEGMQALADSGALSAMFKGVTQFLGHIGEALPNEVYAEQLQQLKANNQAMTLLNQQYNSNTPLYKAIQQSNNQTNYELYKPNIPYRTGASSGVGSYKNGAKIQQTDIVNKINYLNLF